MRTASGALTSYLANNSQYLMADLFIFKTISGYSRYNSSDVDISYGSNIYKSPGLSSPDGPIIKRAGFISKIGMETDTMRMTIRAANTHIIEGLPFVSAAAYGALDTAEVTLLRAFLSDWKTVVDAVFLFSGSVSSCNVSRNKCEIEIKSDVERLATKMPRNLFQPTCVNTLFDSGCGAQRAGFQINGTVGASGNTVSGCSSNLVQTVGWFDQGTIRFTSGANNGYKRTVKSYASGAFAWALPLPYAPANGDTFVALPGCDKLPTTCETKFSNKPKNRSFPFVPAAEVALG